MDEENIVTRKQDNLIAGGIVRRNRWKVIRNTLFPTARSLLIRRSLEQIRLHGFDSVLVIGAGEDPYKQFFGEPRRYICLDIVVHQGRTNIIADGHALPFADGSFDCVFASEVIEHLFDPMLFSDEIRRALIPGGQAILTVPYMFHTHADPHDYWRLSRDGFRRVFGSFSSLELYAQGNRLHVLSDLLTTAFSPTPLLFPFRVLNHLFRFLDMNDRARDSISSAPSGFLVIAKK